MKNQCETSCTTTRFCCLVSEHSTTMLLDTTVLLCRAPTQYCCVVLQHSSTVGSSDTVVLWKNMQQLVSFDEFLLQTSG